jgi:hypothetical protein
MERKLSKKEIEIKKGRKPSCYKDTSKMERKQGKEIKKGRR